MATQTTSGAYAQAKIDAAFAGYCKLIRDDVWTLSFAHTRLADTSMNMYEIAGLAKAIACFQCVHE